MAHHGWIFPLILNVGGYLCTFVSGYLGGILTMLCKYSFDQATELKELIVEIRQSMSALKNLQPKASSNYAFRLKSKLELIRWYWLIRHLVRLPPKKKIAEAAELLPAFDGGAQAFAHPRQREEASFNAKKIIDLLA